MTSTTTQTGARAVLRRLGRSRWFGWVRHVSLVVVTILVVEYVVLPQLVGARQDMTLLASADTLLLVAALALEAASLMSYSALTRVALSPVGRPSYWTLLRIDLSGLGVSHVVPGGGAATVALRYRLLTVAGVRRGDAAAGAAIQTVVSIIALIALFVIGLGLTVPHLGGHPGYEAAGIVALAVLAVLGLAATALMRHTDRALLAAEGFARRVPLLRAESTGRVLRELAQHIARLGSDRRLLRQTAGWAVGNWLFDGVCLWVCLGAYGYWSDAGPLLAVYAAACLLAWLPITPGGLGIVEGVLVPALISFGSDPAVALLGVLTWRLAEYWLPIPLAAATYLSLRVSRR